MISALVHTVGLDVRILVSLTLGEHRHFEWRLVSDHNSRGACLLLILKIKYVTFSGYCACLILENKFVCVAFL